MKKLLVTGGAGFIGSAFVKKGLKYGYEIIVIDALTYAGDLARLREVSRFIKFFEINIINKEALRELFEKEKPNIVVHFAAETHVDRSILDATNFFRTNVEGTLNLLDISLKSGVELFVNVSTDEVYGETIDGKFFEDSPLQPNSPYAVSKAAQDMLGRAFYRTYGLPVITVRPCNNYGPWQYPEKLIPVVIYRALHNLTIPVYGDGRNVREWLFVEDCVEAIFMVIEKGLPGEIYNIGSGVEKMNIEVVKQILALLNKPEELIVFTKDRPGHDIRYSLDSSKIHRDIGWKPKTPFDTGLELTVKWYIDNREWVESKINDLKALWSKVYQ